MICNCAHIFAHILHIYQCFFCAHIAQTHKNMCAHSYPNMADFKWVWTTRKTGFSSTSWSVSDDNTVFYSKFANLIFGTYHWDFTPIAGRASIFSAWILLSIWGRLRSRPLGLRWASGSPRPCWRRLRPSPRRTWSGSSSSYRQNFMIQGL